MSTRERAGLHDLPDAEHPSPKGSPKVTSVPDVSGMDVAGAALAYAEAGLYVGPLKHRSKNPGSILGYNWVFRTSRDPAVIRRWFPAGTKKGVFLHCGRSGLVVFDVDKPENLHHLVEAAVVTEAPPWQNTRPAHPDRRHYLFAVPPGRTLGNSVGGLGGSWGEVRGRNGVIVVAPSEHEEPDGLYTWGQVGVVPVLPDCVAEELPDALDAAEAVTSAEVQHFIAQHDSGDRTQLLDRLVEGWHRKVERGGSRHGSMSGHLTGALKEAAAGCYPAQVAVEALETAFSAAVTAEGHGPNQSGSRTPHEASKEWHQMLTWAVAQAVAADPAETLARAEEHDPQPKGDFEKVGKSSPPRLDVSNTAEAADWLRLEVGRQGTPLAGLFRRGGGLVHTPRIDEDGYVPLVAEDDVGSDDGPAQVRPVDAARLRSWVQFSYPVEKWVESRGKFVAATFPNDAAGLVVNAVELAPALRPLVGVTHTPMLRADGSVLSVEGYDSASARLYLPERGMTVLRVPDEPTASEVKAAHGLIAEMIGGFDFNTEHDRAHYLALLFTPLLRVMVPPPYPLGLIHAHQPGSGKSLLAWILRTLHGGALRPLPETHAEFRKQITSILSVTTAPVVQFDNVLKLSSSQLDALLTTDVWSDRPLGATADVTSRNDRLWIATGNNVAIGGDLLRRVRWVSIDPNVPQPEQRTDFAIPDLKSWVLERRGELLVALLTLLRAWVVDGKPLGPKVSSDDFARWTQTVQGVLGVAGWSGTVGHQDTVQQEGSDEDTEWGDFLAELWRLFGDKKWLAKDLVEHFDLDHDQVPGDMNTNSARAVGMWLRHRHGRWAGDFCLRSAGGRDATVWRVQQKV